MERCWAAASGRRRNLGEDEISGCRIGILLSLLVLVLFQDHSRL